MNGLAEFLTRKNTNKLAISEYHYSQEDVLLSGTKTINILVNKDDNDKIIGSACRYCYQHTNLDPFRSGAYVSTICQECLKNISEIEAWIVNPNKDELEKQGGNIIPKIKRTRKKRRSSPFDTSKLNWENIEKEIRSGSFKLVEQSKKVGLSPLELRNYLVDKWGSKLIFKKGRNGGIFFKQ